MATKQKLFANWLMNKQEHLDIWQSADSAKFIQNAYHSNGPDGNTQPANNNCAVMQHRKES